MFHSSDGAKSLSFQPYFHILNNTNGVLEDAAIWKLNVFKKLPTRATQIKHGSMPSPRQAHELSKSTSWHKIENFLLMTHGADDIIASPDVHIKKFSRTEIIMQRKMCRTFA